MIYLGPRATGTRYQCTRCCPRRALYRALRVYKNVVERATHYSIAHYYEYEATWTTYKKVSTRENIKKYINDSCETAMIYRRREQRIREELYREPIYRGQRHY